MHSFFRISLSLLFCFFSCPFVFSDESAKQLVESNCLNCHLDPNIQAPSLESMSWYTKQGLVAVMQRGKMKSQSAHLTQEEQFLIADFISEAVVDDQFEECQFDLKKKDVLGKSHWSSWGVTNTNTRYQPDSDIDSRNVSNLKLRWVFNVKGLESRSPPVVIGNLLIIGTSTGFIYALDKKTGCVHWSYRAEGDIRSSPLVKLNNAFLYFIDSYLTVYSLNLLDGSVRWKTDLPSEEFNFSTGSPVLYGSKLIIPISTIETVMPLDPFHECCKTSGAVVAVDVYTGELIWNHRVLPKAELIGKRLITRVKKFAPSGAAVWSTPTIDSSGNKIFFGTAQSLQSPASEFSDAIIALDFDTGKRIWSHQTTPKDAFNLACMIPLHPSCPEEDGPDLDFGAAVIYTKDNQGKEIVIAGQKSGWVYAFDPKDGQKIWSKRLGRGGKLGGVHWGMATKGNTLFVGISDREIPSDEGLYDMKPSPGLYSLDISTGNLLWVSSIELRKDCEECNEKNLLGFSAPISITNDVIFAGSLDGRFFAYTTQGKRVWAFDTKKDFIAVNAYSTKAKGGSIDAAGPVIVDDWVFTNSGFGGHDQIPGNVLLAFSLE